MNSVQTFKANKTAVAASVAVLLFAFLMTGSASAAFSAINENTGFSTGNTLTADGDDIFTLVNSNLADVENMQGVTTETGLNDSNSNTGDGATDSGNIDVLGGFSNDFNLNASSYQNAWWSQLVGSGNDTTGASSTNDASATFANMVTATQTNDADLGNDITVDASTGKNTASMNTGTGDVETGNANAATVEENTANGNSFTSSGSIMSALFANMAKNITTGFSSSNTSGSDITNTMDVISVNDADFTNGSDTTLNTGENASDSNTGMGGVDTGNAEGETSISNDANANGVTVEIVGSADNSLKSWNDTTGATSTNASDTSVTGDIGLTSLNDALLSNTASIGSNTGLNTSSTNTGSGNVKTGNGEGRVMIDNGGGAFGFFNENTTSLTFTSSLFDLMAGNMTTGFSSSNDASSTLSNEVDVVNLNGAEVTNDATVDIETGLNESNSNTGDGAVDTGNAEAGVSMTNDLNVNKTTIKQMAVGTMMAGNDTTGASSTNAASVSVMDDLSITNVNSGTITNTSTITSSTGSNESSFNTGSGSSKTGNSSVLFGFINQGNGNFSIVQ